MDRPQAKFMQGLDLSEAFHTEAIMPILHRAWPQLHYGCGLIGPGSEVLGFDDEMSTDHQWGPRAMLFLSNADREHLGPRISQLLSSSPPHEFRGYPTHFTDPDPNDNGVRHLANSESGPIRHRVEIWTIRDFVGRYTGLDTGQPLEWRHGLAIPQPKPRTIVGGRIFRDDLNVREIQSGLSYYPRDVWLYLLAAGWRRIEQEEHLMGRSGYVGDERGSAIIATRLVRDIMRLCFLLERQYVPYPKWFGTAFRSLTTSAHLTPFLQAALNASSWKDRESPLSQA